MFSYKLCLFSYALHMLLDKLSLKLQVYLLTEDQPQFYTQNAVLQWNVHTLLYNVLFL